MRPPRRQQPESVTGTGDLSVSGVPTSAGGPGQSIEDGRPRGFWAIINNHAGGNAYGFVRCDDGVPGVPFPELEGADEYGDGEDLTAWEANGRTDVPADGSVRVWLEPLRLGPGLAFTYTPGGGAGGGTEPSTSTSPGSVAGLTESSCIAVTLVARSGACSEIPAQTVYLASTGADEWTSTSDFTHDLGAGPVVFTRAAPVPTLTIDGQDGYFLSADSTGRYYEFGGSALCAGESVACANSFVVKVSCVACPGSSGSFAPPSYQMSQSVAGDEETTEYTFYVSGLEDGTAPSQFQMSLDASGVTGGIGQFQAVLTAPDGVTQFALMDRPATTSGTATAPQAVMIFQPTATAPSGPVQDLAQATGTARGQFQAKGDFSTFAGNPNGTWTLSLKNYGTGPGTLLSARLCFGVVSSGLSIAASIDPTTGESPLEVTLTPGVTGGTPTLVSVDWDDGSDVTWHAPGEEPTHEYDDDGEYEVIVRAYGPCGTYVEDSVVVTVGSGITPGNSCATALAIDLDTDYVATNPATGVDHWYSLGALAAGDYRVTLSETGTGTGGGTANCYLTGFECDVGGTCGALTAGGCGSISVGDPFTEVYLVISGASATPTGTYTLRVESGACP